MNFWNAWSPNSNKFMAFLVYRVTPRDEHVRYERFKPLRLGGPRGLIAQHVKRLPEWEAPSWTLDSTALLAGFTAEDGTLALVFDATGRDTTAVCLYELRRIHGSCRDTSTQLALDFSILVDGEISGDSARFVQQFDVRLSAPRPLICEVLTLTGGPSGGDWKWAEPPLRLGATVVGGSSGAESPPNPWGQREEAG